MDGFDFASKEQGLQKLHYRLEALFEKTTIYAKSRWLAIFVLWAVIVVRVILAQGYYVSLYCLAVFEINLFIRFLSPIVDPDTDNLILPRNASEDFRPFERALPEFHFWRITLVITLLSAVSVFIPFLDLPAFWPLLLLYFIILSTMLLRKQIAHMIEHRYVPFNIRKQRYCDVAR